MIPPNLKSLIDLLKSEPMFKLLTKLTGLKLAELESEDVRQDTAAASSANDELGNGRASNPCSTCEIRHWSHGSYTLMHDSDPGLHEFALDVMLFFGCDGEWSFMFKSKEGVGWEGKGREGKGREGMGWDGMGWDGMGWDGMGREGKGREGKGREGKGREGKGREGKGREGKGREGKGREGKGRDGITVSWS